MHQPVDGMSAAGAGLLRSATVRASDDDGAAAAVQDRRRLLSKRAGDTRGKGAPKQNDLNVHKSTAMIVESMAFIHLCTTMRVSVR